MILGTVALAYGSVPLYKMVCHALTRTRVYPKQNLILIAIADLPTDRLGWSAHPHPPNR